MRERDGKSLNLNKTIAIAIAFVAFLGLIRLGFADSSVKASIYGALSSNVSKVVFDKFDLEDVPKYSGKAYVRINGNKPFFTEDDMTTTSFEVYSKLDKLGRCGGAMACIGKDIMPTEKRESIGQVKPTGWHTVRYDDLIKDKYLYNRCHLIAFELVAENANKRNLITGTRYMNVQGMLPFENMVAGYVKSTGNHVMYRVTPIYKDKNLVASGVLMEAKSVEDNGKRICFNAYCYNVQPHIVIDYKTGNSHREKGSSSVNNNNGSSSSSTATKGNYVLNINTKKFHKKSCSSVRDIKKKNIKYYKGSKSKLISQGYSPCKNCNP